jgi:hypothetical protein
MASKSLKPKKKKIKKLVASVVFKVVGRAIRACYNLDSRVKNDLDSIPEGAVLAMSVMPSGPALAIKREGGKIIIFKEYEGKPELDIQFKSIESALLVLTGEIGVARSFAEMRFIMFGDIAYGSTFVRVMNIVESYLFPKIWAGYLLNNQVPERERSMARVYIGTLFNK